MMSRKLFTLAFVFALIVFVAVHFLEFSGSVPDFVKKSGGGVLLDMTPEFTEDATYNRLHEYGEQGRENYAFRNVTVDVLLPLALLPFLVLFMLRALKQTAFGSATRGGLMSLPLAYVVLDLVENGLVLAMISRFPERLHFAATVLPYVTVSKRAASILALLLPLFILAVVFIRDQIRGRHVAH